MAAFVKKLLDLYHKHTDFQFKLFWIAVPTVVFIGIVTFFASLLEHQPPVTLFFISLCFIIPAIVALICVKTQKIDICYRVICFFLNCVIIPMILLVGGGLRSGMPIFCAGAVILCSFCSKKTHRIFLLIATILIDSFVFYLNIIRPDLFLELSPDTVNADIYYSYLIVSIALFVVGSRLITVYQLNHKLSVILEDHMDARVSSALLESDGRCIERRCKVAVMFADICNFTSISESMDTKTLAEYLNTYFEIADKAIHGNGGVIDKYIGDCVMAYWTDENEDGSAAVKACQASLDLKRMLKERCAEINDRFFCDLEYTAGINYGQAFVGDIGPDERKDFTIIGDAVNVASRIQDIAPQGGTYLSETVAKLVDGKVNIRKVPKKVTIKGKTDPIDIYSLVGENSEEEDDLVFEERSSTGYVLYVCGSRGSYSLSGKRYAEFGGETSCYVLKKDDYALIVDCGTGLQRARAIIEKCTRIDIILTHLHYDHLIGLLDWSIFPKGVKLTFYGTFDKWLGDKSLSRLFEPPYWPVNLFSGDMVTVNYTDSYPMGKDIQAQFFPASHPNNTSLIMLKVGHKRVCVMADCENPEDIPEDVARDTDILIYDGMYEDQYYHEHVGWGHSTWESGVRLAEKVHPKRLIISHHNPRNSDEKLRGLEIQAQTIYSATTFAKAGDRFSL